MTENNIQRCRLSDEIYCVCNDWRLGDCRKCIFSDKSTEESGVKDEGKAKADSKH